jgi:hypothetical protein
MFKLSTSDKDLISYLAASLFTFGVMLALIYLLGEVHGLIVTVIILIMQGAQMQSRLGALQREVRALREPQDQRPAE